MQFSDTTNKNGVIQLTESLCGLGDGGITNDTTLFKQITGYVNQAYMEVVTAILDVDTAWKFDDFNYTDYPEAPITMVSGQADYTLPVATTGANVATLLRINRVWVLDSSGNRVQLSRLDDDKDLDTTSGMPSSYRLQGKSIFLSPKPLTGSVTLTSGLIIQFERIPDAFTSSDTTQQAGFMATFHDLLALKASAWYLLPINPELSTAYEQRFAKRLVDLQSAYAHMNDDTPTRLTPSVHNNK